MSAIAFTSLWVIYITVSSLYQLEKIPFVLTPPPAWYICSKDLTDAQCVAYCALEENIEDPECEPLLVVEEVPEPEPASTTTTD